MDPVPGSHRSIRDGIVGRHSCRAFLPDAAPADLIRDILSLAQQSASWCNTQPWQVVVTSSGATARFQDALQTHVAGCPDIDTDFAFPAAYRGIYADRQRAYTQQLMENLGQPALDPSASASQPADDLDLFGAPHVAIVHTPADLGTYGAVDCGGYIATFQLAAYHFGLASVALATLATQSLFIREYFGIARDRRILCGIAFGYADASAHINALRTPRAAIDTVARFVP